MISERIVQKVDSIPRRRFVRLYLLQVLKELFELRDYCERQKSVIRYELKGPRSLHIKILDTNVSLGVFGRWVK